MAVFNYRKFKVLLDADSKKTQGLRTGDIVRRQYFDGQNVVYSLMCVLGYGIEETVDAETNDVIRQPYFIGALLEGDAPQTSQLLDFVRVTSLFDTDRSGALYLTASDSDAPFMDVIDGIGRNMSLCWPTNIANTDSIDSKTQYVTIGNEYITSEYMSSLDGNGRVCHITRTGENAPQNEAIGIRQDFYNYIANPNRVLVSFKVKASKRMNANVSLKYINGLQTDGSIDFEVTTDWEYKFFAITVDYSGRHLRTLSVAFKNFYANDEAWIADLNIILLSSVSSFGDASQTRIGKLDGIVDPVFGRLDGYGGYLQKMFASGSAHVSGTLTAGDENGFGATFYAGKIHRNAFLNSIMPAFLGSISPSENMANPTGIGEVYELTGDATMSAQRSDWLMPRIGTEYCFSCWIYAKKECLLSIYQNGSLVGILQIPYSQAHAWYRQSVSFKLQPPANAEDDMLITLSPSFIDTPSREVTNNESVLAQDHIMPDEDIMFFASPQVELGDTATQYQPTDNKLNYTDDYGAWFARGGIGGTIQNPLLMLNYDGNGSIGARGNAFVLRNDGSGHLANANIVWDENGNVTFGEGVKLTWDNIGGTPPEEFIHRAVRITGQDTFVISSEFGVAMVTPEAITLTAAETNLSSTADQRQWYYSDGLNFYPIPNAKLKTFVLAHDSYLWDYSPNVLVLKYEVNIDGNIYYDTISIRKQRLDGYEVRITSRQGELFGSGVCHTVLEANVYYQGELMEEIPPALGFRWHKYSLPDTDNEVEDWWLAVEDGAGNNITPEIDRNAKQITLDYTIISTDMFVCDLIMENNQFPYYLPITF